MNDRTGARGAEIPRARIAPGDELRQGSAVRVGRPSRRSRTRTRTESSSFRPITVPLGMTTSSPGVREAITAPAAAPMMAPITAPLERSPFLRTRPRMAPAAAPPPIVAASRPVSFRPCWTNEASIGTEAPEGSTRSVNRSGELRPAADLARRDRLDDLAQDLGAGRDDHVAVLHHVLGHADAERLAGSGGVARQRGGELDVEPGAGRNGRLPDERLLLGLFAPGLLGLFSLGRPGLLEVRLDLRLLGAGSGSGAGPRRPASARRFGRAGAGGWRRLPPLGTGRTGRPVRPQLPACFRNRRSRASRAASRSASSRSRASRSERSSSTGAGVSSSTSTDCGSGRSSFV